MQGYVWKKGLIFGVIFLLMASNGLAVGVGTKVVNTNAIRADDSVSAGESDDTWWPMFHHDLNHTGVSSSSAPETNTLLCTGWIIAQSSPAVVDGKVFIGSHDYKVYCLDAKTGSELWEFPTGYFISSSPAVVGDRVYIGSFDGNLYCLNASTGGLIWVCVLIYTIWTSSPTVYDGRVYIGALDFELHCIDASTGTQLWNFSTGDSMMGKCTSAHGIIRSIV
jgi:outer membrane protein assembly factor BamB